VTQAIPKQGGAGWDEHRNSSRVFSVPPDALPAALKALRTIDPDLRRWIEDGHPRLTDDEHRARFGEPWQAAQPRRARAPT
jgi:hypothetical protein